MLVFSRLRVEQPLLEVLAALILASPGSHRGF